MSKSTFTRGWTLVVAIILLAVAVFEPVGGRPASAQTPADPGVIAYVNRSTGDIHLISPDGTKVITTPAQAVAAGADYLVVGRPITRATDPQAALRDINAEIDRLFDQAIQILAEPGRFLVATAAMSVAKIIGKAVRDSKTCYYIDDSVYHTFSGIIFDHCPYHFKSFKTGKTEVCAVFGQTCDALDTISLSEELPELQIEDLVYSEKIGAYSSASATWFNGFPPAKVVHVNQAAAPAQRALAASERSAAKGLESSSVSRRMQTVSPGFSPAILGNIDGMPHGFRSSATHSL